MLLLHLLRQHRPLNRVEPAVVPGLQVGIQRVTQQPVINKRPVLLVGDVGSDNLVEESRVLARQKEVELVAGIGLVELLLLRRGVFGPVHDEVEFRQGRVVVQCRQQAIGCPYRINDFHLGTENILGGEHLALAQQACALLLCKMHLGREETPQAQIGRLFGILFQRPLTVDGAARIHCVDVKVLAVRQFLYG